MCGPAISAVIQGVGMAVSTVNTINKYKETSENAKYQTQALLANMKNSRDLALEQKQEGIEASRKEKLLGIQKASLLMANNAANGFSVDSDTNVYNQQSIIDFYNENARNIQDKYESNANKHLIQANNYLNQAKQTANNAKRDLYSIALTGLGSTTSVASRWYAGKSA